MITNQIHDVQHVLDRAAHALFLFLPGRAHEQASTSLDATTGGAMLTDEQILDGVGRRMVVDMPPPSTEMGLRARTRIGEIVAGMGLRFAPVPEGFAPFPGRTAPPMELDPDRGQRVAVEGRITLGRQEGHGFHTIGTGLTWPRSGEAGAVDLAITGSLLSPWGQLAGHRGVYTLSGRYRSPTDFRLVMTLRLLDLGLDLLGERELPTLCPPSDEISRVALDGVSFLAIRTFADPVRTRMINAPAGGQGFEAPETQTLITTDFAIDGEDDLRARQNIGAPIGEHNLQIFYFPSPQNPGTPLSPIPFFDEEIFLLDTADGRRLGSFRGDVVEGRSQQCPIPGAAPDLAPQIFGGIGRVEAGEGCFEGARGLITNVGIGTVSPHLTSILYLVELDDPEGRFRLP